jgi:hypothetical protein
MFAPAWTHEAKNGKFDFHWQQVMDMKLWQGGVREIAPTNASGMMSSEADAAKCSAGWTVTENGGQGWSAIPVADGPAATAFVTSHAWCESWQCIAVDDFSPDDVCIVSWGVISRCSKIVLWDSSLAWGQVGEWIRGTGPNVTDFYCLTVRMTFEGV